MPSTMPPASGCGRFRLLRKPSCLRRSSRKADLSEPVSKLRTQRDKDTVLTAARYRACASRTQRKTGNYRLLMPFFLCVFVSLSLCVFQLGLLRAQQQPRGVIDLDRIREIRYDTSIWWDPGRGIALPPSKDYDNASGQLRLLNESGEVETKGQPFFTAIGSNGRACVTCHQPSNAMSLSLDLIRDRWAGTKGKDPLFASVDGSNCPDLAQDKQESHSLLLERGLFRIALPWPPATGKQDFRIEVVRDPTGCNKNPALISVYRRPRVAANLQYIALPTGETLMTDGRERTLQSQATSAALTHEQASAAPTREQLQQIEDFERQLFMAQEWDVLGGQLSEPGGPPLLGTD